VKINGRKFALLCSAVLAAALAARASAQIRTAHDGAVCAVLTDGTGTRIEITNIGTAPGIVCHGVNTICQEAFHACADNRFEIGAERFLPYSVPDVAYNLLPFVPADDPLNSDNPILDRKANPFNLCRPFIQVNTEEGARILFLQPKDPKASPLVYDLDDQALDLNGDGDTLEPGEDQVPLGALVQVMIDNKPDPVARKCLGVRTTIQHRKGTCKVWKIRKFYNTCSFNVTLTQIKEFELPCECGIYATTGPAGALTAVASIRRTGQFITLQPMGSTGANPAKATTPYQASAAGSVHADGNFFGFFGEFLNCRIIPPPANAKDPFAFFTSSPVNVCARAQDEQLGRYLEVFLSFAPGGVMLKPVTQPGSEKIVTFCLDVE
jgi:hypothetical protein